MKGRASSRVYRMMRPYEVYNAHMADPRLQFRSKLSCRSTKDLIFILARHGDHMRPDLGFPTDAEVERFLKAGGFDLQEVIRECRQFPGVPVPLFENAVSSSWKLAGAGAKVEASGVSVESPGTITLSAYRARFEAARNALHRAVTQGSYPDLQTMTAEGVASVEAYIAYRAERWNAANPTDQLADSPQRKIGFDVKVSEWVPKMSGRPIDRSGPSWSHFSELKRIREDEHTHPKSQVHGVSFSDFASIANLFRTGIADVLFRFHIHFSERVPSQIIRARFLPDVEMVAV